MLHWWYECSERLILQPALKGWGGRRIPEPWGRRFQSPPAEHSLGVLPLVGSHCPHFIRREGAATLRPTTNGVEWGEWRPKRVQHGEMLELYVRRLAPFPHILLIKKAMWVHGRRAGQAKVLDLLPGTRFRLGGQKFQSRLLMPIGQSCSERGRDLWRQIDGDASKAPYLFGPEWISS